MPFQKNNNLGLKHGHNTQKSGTTPEYRAWQNMLARCRVETHPKWKYYGGRGIKVCERWVVFQNFLDDMGLRPSSLHSIDRKNVNGNYEPDNCRWATNQEQSENKRRTLLIEYGGKLVTARQLSELTGLKQRTIHRRKSVGMSDFEIANTPLGTRPSTTKTKLKYGTIAQLQ